MCRSGLRLIPLLFSSICIALPSTAQSPASQLQSTQAETATTAPGFTLQTFSRMVTLELVVKDAKGNHITGLQPSDFRVFEQTPTQSKEKREQKIASFREAHVADLAKQAAPEVPLSAGVYSNSVQHLKVPVPPTILLVDGLNTATQYQAQVHVQMMKMLRQLPPNVPVAVFLLGERLVMLQGFTTDPRLLQIALHKAISTAGKGVADIDPKDDPYAPGNSFGGFSALPDQSIIGAMTKAAKDFDEMIYASDMDMRVNRTIEAMLSIGRNLSGYPGRKNLLWLSTAFPISINSDASDLVGNFVKRDYSRNNWGKLQEMSGALSDAKISVYPVNIAGVQTLSFYSAESRPPDGSPAGVSSAVDRQTETLSNQQETMEVLAHGTGGKVCVGDNDLGDCIRKAMEDSSDYYELEYYPDSPNWNGDYRKVLITTEQHGAHLAYRQGYFATPLGSGDPKAQQVALQADCQDFLDATSVLFTAKSLPADSPGQLKFAVSIDPTGLTLAPAADGSHLLNVSVAVCTFNEKGWPLQLMNYPIDRKLDPSQYNSLLSGASVRQSIFVPAPKPAAVRLLVQDVATGRLGSVHIDLDDVFNAASAPGQSTPQQAQPH